MTKHTEEQFYKEWGEIIAKLREQSGMKKKDLANRLGVSPSIVSDFENGGKKLSAWRIHQCLEVFGQELTFDQKKTSLMSA